MLRIESRVAHATLKKPLPFKAFAAGAIHRVEFPAGMTLYKVTEGTAVDASGGVRPGLPASRRPGGSATTR